MTQKEMAEFFSQRNRYWQDHDADALTAGHSQEGEIVSPLWGNIKGESAIHKSYIDFFKIFPDAEYRMEHLLTSGDRAAKFIQMTGTQQADFSGFPPSGRKFQFRAASLLFFSGGQNRTRNPYLRLHRNARAARRNQGQSRLLKPGRPCRISNAAIDGPNIL